MVKIKQSKARVKELALSITAILLLFIGFPITTYFVYNFERNLDGGISWESIQEEDLQNVTIGDGGLDRTAPLLEVQYNSILDMNWVYTEHESMILWDYDNGSLERLILAPLLPKGSYNELWDWQVLFTNMTIDSMITDDINMCKFQIYSAKAINVGLVIHQVSDGSVDILKNTSFLVKDEGARTGNHTLYFNWTALDLLDIKAEKGGDSLISIYIWADSVNGFIPGDQISFNVAFNPVDDDDINQFLILKIGAGILTVVYGIVALASTGLWNPFTKDNPGIVDRWLSWGSNKASGYINRKTPRRK